MPKVGPIQPTLAVEWRRFSRRVRPHDKGLAFLSLPLSSSGPWSAAVEEEEDGLGAGANELAVATWSRQVHRCSFRMGGRQMKQQRWKPAVSHSTIVQILRLQKFHLPPLNDASPGGRRGAGQGGLEWMQIARQHPKEKHEEPPVPRRSRRGHAPGLFGCPEIPRSSHRIHPGLATTTLASPHSPALPILVGHLKLGNAPAQLTKYPPYRALPPSWRLFNPFTRVGRLLLSAQFYAPPRSLTVVYLFGKRGRHSSQRIGVS